MSTSLATPSPDEDLNVLYSLSDDPELALAQIEAAYGFERDAVVARDWLLRHVERLLTDLVVSAAVTLRIAGVYGLPHTSAGIRGPLGLYLGLNAATALASIDRPNDDALEAARSWLGDADVIDCFYDFYGVDRDAIDLADIDAHLHRVGTTSLIFRCSMRLSPKFAAGPSLALKCLLPRYFGIRVIRVKTHDYKHDHRLRHPCVPKVLDSTEKWILMDFVDGPTLAEKIAERVVPDVLPLVPSHLQTDEIARQRALAQEDIAFIRKVFTALCVVLGDLFEQGHLHLDLSPSNIIVTSESSDKVEIALIDFGHNFAVTERVGSSSAIRRAALYVAPELIENGARHLTATPDAWRSDAYSLGVILLDMAARRRIDKDDFTRELERLWQGDGEWNGALGLARIVEELIDVDPERRLVLMPESPSPNQSDSTRSVERNPYRYLGKLIRQETEVQALYEARSAGVGFGLLKGSALLKLRRHVQLMNLLDAQKTVQEPVDDTYSDYPALGFWAGVAIVSWLLVLSAFVILTAADLHVSVFSPAIEWAVKKLHPPFNVGEFWSNVPGRLVALTFALTQVTYYVNNYSIVSLKRLGSTLGLVSERVLRANTVLLTIPVMWAMVWQPTAWPLCSGLGALLVVLNNYLTLRIARNANAVGGQRFSTLGEVGKRFVNDIYSEWWMLMGFYCLALIAIGVLLDAGVAHDAGLFAALVVVINVVKMYRLNCVRFAPEVRGCLSRAVLTLRRAERLPDEPSAVGAEASEAGLPSGVKTVLQAWEVVSGGIEDVEAPGAVTPALPD